MSVLRSIEAKIEGLFEGVFGRAFRTHVQPVELARKLAKEMDDHRSVSVSRVYVPNEYTVYLSPGDRAQYASYEGSLVGELQEYLSEHALRERYAMLTPPRVVIVTDADLEQGEFGIATRVVDADALEPVHTPPPVPHVPAPPPIPELRPPVVVPVADTVIHPDLPVSPEVSVAEPAQPTAKLTVNGDVHALATGPVVIGRSRDCDITIEDGNVSRRHAEIRHEDGSWWLLDLGSTNGTELDGARIERAKLVPGARIRLGGTTAVFDASPP